MSTSKPRITGIGGIFFKCQNPEELRAWYGEHFDLKTNQYGILFQSRQVEFPYDKQYAQWSTFSEDSKYMDPSKRDFMINYRVENIEGLVKQLRQAGVTICDAIESYDYGKFVHVMDPEGNKIELWEPVDEVFTDAYEADANG